MKKIISIALAAGMVMGLIIVVGPTVVQAQAETISYHPTKKNTFWNRYWKGEPDTVIDTSVTITVKKERNSMMETNPCATTQPTPQPCPPEQQGPTMEELLCGAGPVYSDPCCYDGSC